MLLNRRAVQAGAGRPAPQGRPAAARRAFGRWRTQRPFVGSVLVILAGLELLLSGPLDVGALADLVGAEGVPNMQLGVGIEGIQATILPIALLLLGVLSMVQPVHRVFYGVMILAISVYTLSGVNLGGWIIGFLLGVIGGIVVVSWSPSDAAAAAGERGTEGSAPVAPDAPAPEGQGSGVFEVSDGGPSADGRTDGRPDGQSDGRTDIPGGDHGDGRTDGPALPARSAAVVLAGALVLGGVQPSALRTADDDCWDPISWIPIVTCDEEGGDPEPSVSPSASPSGTASDDPGGDDPVGDVVDDVTDGIGDVTGGGSGGDDAEGDDASSEDSDAAAGEIFSSDESEKGLSVGYVCDGEKQNVTLPMLPAGQDNRNTFSLPADLRTSDLEISGIRSIALVSVPVTHEVGRRDALRIVADHVTAPGFWLRTYAYDTEPDGTPVEAGTDTGAGYVSMDGNATMYISGINLGCPDFEDIADEPPESIIAWLLALSGAQIDLLGATSDVQVWSEFREQVRGDPGRPIGRGPEAGDP